MIGPAKPARGNLTYTWPRMLRRLACFLPLLLAVVSRAQAPTYSYRVVRTYPHSTTSYTEGLFFEDGLMYEGTGLEGHSGLLIYPLGRTTPTQQVDLPPQFFGEGILANGKTLLQWTWQSHTGFVYDRTTLKLLRTFRYTGEGWGMTRTAHELITSDGSATLRFRDPDSFAETRSIVVHDGPTAIDQLNELEYVHGLIYSNVWHSDRVAEISPADGHVVAWIDFAGLLPAVERLTSESVLNGIAYDTKRDRLFVTGKQWPRLFEVQVVPRGPRR